MSSTVEILGQGPVAAGRPGTAEAVAAGSRIAAAPNGELVCSFMLQSKLGINDFKTALARSSDGGKTWSKPQTLWPHLTDKWSTFVSISRAPTGDLFAYGSRSKIDTPGETFWSQANFGIKPNELIWARSRDGGKSWSEPAVIPMPTPGSAEVPGPLCVTKTGRWLGCYAPYNNFDPNTKVPRNQLAMVASDDQGKSWSYQPAMRFDKESHGSAEAWVIQLADERLLSTCWQFDYADMSDRPNPYTISENDGKTWHPHRSTGIQGQSTGLAALPDGRAVMVYNQRKHGEPGVYLAVAKPDKSGFNVQANERIWSAPKRTQHEGSSTSHENWEDFSFGEPGPCVLPDGTVIVAIWCIQPDFTGIWSVRVRVR